MGGGDPYAPPAKPTGGRGAIDHFTASTLIQWLGGLQVTEGPLAGQPLQVLHWQARFIRGLYRPGVATAAVSVARGNGKTTLTAGIAAAAVAGPLVQPRGLVVVVAGSHSQARIGFDHVLHFLRWRLGEPLKRPRWRLRDSLNNCELTDMNTGARLRVIGSDPRLAHGLAPLLVLMDEPASWKPTTRDKMLAALRTSAGKVEGCRLVALGTRPRSPEHWFRRWLEGGEADYSQVHAGREGDPPGWRRTWKRANPSLDHLPALEATIRREWALAKRDPVNLPAFMAYRLNGGVGDVEESLVLSRSEWEAVESDGPPEGTGRYVLGVDLGGSAAMSGAAAYWPENGRVDAFGVFGALPSLTERGRLDQCGRLYSDMYRRGELLTHRGRKTPDLPLFLDQCLQRWGRPGWIISDNYKASEFGDAIRASAIRGTWYGIRRWGPKDGAEDLRRFRVEVADGRMIAPVSLLIRAALAEARTKFDKQDNEHFAKGTEAGRRKRARDDVAAAMILAVAEGQRRRARMLGRPRQVVVAR